MLLKLEVVGAQAGRLGEHRCVVFATEGGTIGRVPGNDWVLPDQFVSSRHAAIQYADGQFYVIDTSSSNGVFLNAPNFRLEQGDRKSTRLNSSHEWTSYAVYCFK